MEHYRIDQFCADLFAKPQKVSHILVFNRPTQFYFNSKYSLIPSFYDEAYFSLLIMQPQMSHSCLCRLCIYARTKGSQGFE